MNYNITINKIRNSLYDAYLDTEYREALASSLMVLNYINDSPLNMYYGSDEQREELNRVESKILTADEISEIIHMMMYKMRNDFQYIQFKPVALKYLNIVNQMRKEKQNHLKNKTMKKPQCDFKNNPIMFEMIGIASNTLKKNNMYNESIQMIERATMSYDYDEAFNIIKEYVDVIEEKKESEEEEEFE